MKKFNHLLLLLLITFSFSASKLHSQKLTHEMTDEERTQMPYYLQQIRKRQLALTPPSKARSIAEFEQMQGALITYPLGIPISMVIEMAEDDIVYTIVDNIDQENNVNSFYQNKGVNINNCVYVHASTNSHWTRDYGPWFIAGGNEISIINFTYNRPRPNDNRIPIKVADFLNITYYNMDLVHCGGNYMTDGLGIAVSTDLVYDENDDMSYDAINQVMANYTGTDTYHVTDDPQGDYIKHVDCWGKFLAVDKILIARVPTSNSQYNEYEEIVEYFRSQTSSYGTPYRIYRVDSPNGEPYTNSLILNKKVYVPLDNSYADNDAINVYKQAMPGYEVVGFKGNWYSTDAAHCRVKGIADTNMLYIEHIPLSGKVSNPSGYKLSADIIPYSSYSINESEVGIYYRINGGDFQFEPMTAAGGNTYSGTISAQPEGSSVEYYLHAEDNSGRESDYPLIGSGDPFLFTVNSNTIDKPVASFSAYPKEITVGSSVQFTDESLNNPTDWTWTFIGGYPENSTEKNPKVAYSEAGTYSVMLTVKNQAGADTKTMTGYITVKENVGCGR